MSERGLVTGSALLAACASVACVSHDTQRLDLYPAGARPELRSDVVDLPFLFGQPTLERGGWREGPGPSRVVWSHDPEPWLEVPFATPSEKEVRLTARGHGDLGPRLEVELVLNESPVGNVTLGPNDQHFRLLLPISRRRRPSRSSWRRRGPREEAHGSRLPSRGRPDGRPCSSWGSAPAFVVFLVDTLRADHLGLYGHERATSPNLDALSREAITFNDCSAQSSWTAPSVATSGTEW